MNGIAEERWQVANAAYLEAALRWLRLRLARLSSDAPVSERPLDERSGCWPLARGARRADPVAPPPPRAKVSARSVEKALEAKRAAEEAELVPALVLLARRFGLSEFERDVLLLCTAIDLDTGIGALCARAQGDASLPFPTLSLAMLAFDDPAWDVRAWERPLRYWQLIEVDEHGPQPLTRRPLRADERIVDYVKGLNRLDERLASLLEPLPPPAGDPADLPASQARARDEVVWIFASEQEGDRPPVVQLVGPDSRSKQWLARHAASELGVSVYRLQAEWIPKSSSELASLARLWHRESLLVPVTLLLDVRSLEGADSGEVSRSWRRFLTLDSTIVMLDTRDAVTMLGRPHVVVEVEKPLPTELQRAWQDALGEGSSALAAELAQQFRMDMESVRRTAKRVLQATGDEDGDLRERVWKECAAQTRPQMDLLAQRIEPKATWDHLVLRSTEMSVLRELAEQVRHRGHVYDRWGFRRSRNRGLGISALFAGESGTGKTMAAEVIASDLRLALYRIDLSAVVSKYIGETEKNLRRLFDAAEDGGAILLFDEADALFGKRSEVKDSHDRYANIEIDYLLQRMESYRGIAILTTNMKGTLDSAFLRRLRFVVEFPFPGPEERERIWRGSFPPEVPTDELDWAFLASLSLTGGSIQNVALNAAFLAAAEGTVPTMPLVLRAARTEYRKLDRPVHDDEFEWTRTEGVPS